MPREPKSDASTETTRGLTAVDCAACSRAHLVSPSGMGVVIEAYGRGELQTVGSEGVSPLCFLDAITSLTDEQRRDYRSGNFRFVV